MSALIRFVLMMSRRQAGDDAVAGFRSELGRSILLGLEFLVAADIINTVAVEPTLGSLAVLGGIVLIRTFLSFSLEVEIEGRWPWQRLNVPRATQPTRRVERIDSSKWSREKSGPRSDFPTWSQQRLF